VNVDEMNSDDRLMERAAIGDASAFDTIVARHQHRLQRFAARMLAGDSAAAADVGTGAFLRLWECRTTYRPSGRLDSWLFTTVYRLCLDLIAQEGRCIEVEMPEDELEDRASELAPARLERSELGEAVRHAVSALPEAHRAVLILAVYEEMTYEQISDALDIPIGTVASRKNHAVALLKRRLSAWEESR
jgi:RNA polymerase sigma-70 factor (ECF subfamily)